MKNLASAPSNSTSDKTKALSFAKRHIARERGEPLPEMLAIETPPEVPKAATKRAAAADGQTSKRFKPSSSKSSSFKTPIFFYTVEGVNLSGGRRGTGLVGKDGCPYPGAPRLVCDPPIQGQPAGFFGEEPPQPKGPTIDGLHKEIKQLSNYLLYLWGRLVEACTAEIQLEEEIKSYHIEMDNLIFEFADVVGIRHAL
jgi:hypothetical protein